MLIIKSFIGTSMITATQGGVTTTGTLTVNGTSYIMNYSLWTLPTSAGLSVAYGNAGANGTGVAQWIIGGSGEIVFWYSSRPSQSGFGGGWRAMSAASAFAPFPVCNSIGYSNGIWVASNNTNSTNAIARSTDGGTTWVSVPRSTTASFTGGCADVAANSYCNFSLAYADYSNDTNLRSWVAIPGTKNLMFEGGVNTVATVSSNIVASVYEIQNTTTIPTTASAMVTPPGAVATTYGTMWTRLGTTDISGVNTGEQSGYSVSLSADGTTVAIGASNNGGNTGVTRIYKLTGNVWTRLGTTDISGVNTGEQSGYSVSLSADGTTVAIGAPGNNSNTGVTRIYKIDTFGNITYTSSNSSVADIYGNLLLIRGAAGTSNIVATRGATTTTGTLTVTGTTYTLVYSSASRAWWVAGGVGTSNSAVVAA